MDISIFSALSLVAIFLPLIYGLYLFISRLRLSFVNKRVLNWGCSIVNLFSFLAFVFTLFFASETEIIKNTYNIFNIEKFSLELGFLINEENILFLIFASFVCSIVSLYSNVYFSKKKQFIFTKQRFYGFLSILSSLTYLFLVSANLLQSVILLIIQSIVVLIFSYIDIFKRPTNYNITRFYRINHLGNFALLSAFLILFRYAILEKGYIASDSLSYLEFNPSISYMYGLSSSFEFIFMTICFVVALFSRLGIFPLSCYYSFFANSSNIFYLSCYAIANTVCGIYLLLKILPLIELSNICILCIEIIAALSALVSFFQILFERNIKIIFGYLLSIMNSIFVILFLNFDIDLIQYIFYGVNLIFIIILMILFMIDKTNFKKRLINKQFGFVLERSHIAVFETVPVKIAEIFEIFDDKILQNITKPLFKVLDFISLVYVQKTNKLNNIKSIRNILIIFALIALFAIFLALFGGFKC